MTRVKRGIQVKKRHKKVLKQASGFWGSRNNLFRRAKETLMRAMAYAFKGRKLRKRDFRALFISRIKAAAVEHGTSYSKFICGLKRANIELNRKMLSQIAIYEPSAFAAIVNEVK